MVCQDLKLSETRQADPLQRAKSIGCHVRYQELDSGKKGMDTGWHAWQLLQMGQEWSWMLKGTWCLALQGFPGQYTASDTPRKGLGARVSMAQSQQVTGFQQGGGINI